MLSVVSLLYALIQDAVREFPYCVMDSAPVSRFLWICQRWYYPISSPILSFPWIYNAIALSKGDTPIYVTLFSRLDTTDHSMLQYRTFVKSSKDQMIRFDVCQLVWMLHNSFHPGDKIWNIGFVLVTPDFKLPLNMISWLNIYFLDIALATAFPFT